MTDKTGREMVVGEDGILLGERRGGEGGGEDDEIGVKRGRLNDGISLGLIALFLYSDCTV